LPPALTQADLDKLDKAIALGVRRVTYSSGTVEYPSVDEMMKVRSFVAAQLGSDVQPMSTLAVFCRD
jgi:hypothetical protein